MKIIQADITTLKVDAIVNAANASLLGGGGVDGAVHRAGGPAILEECRQIGGCETGQAVITTAGRLPASYVIHTVGPIYRDGQHNEPLLLQSCYQNCLKLARAKGLKTVAFPNISTGVYGYPKNEAAKIALQTVQKILEQDDWFTEIIFCCFDTENFRIYQNFLKS